MENKPPPFGETPKEYEKVKIELRNI